jgi:tol-pal system protein YbgF
MRRSWTLPTAALLLAMLLSTPARAGVFDDEEARKRIEQLREQVQLQLTELANRTEITSRNQIEFANLNEAIKADIAKLRGQIEVLTYELEATQKRQKDFYIDLDNRLRKLEQMAAASAEPAKPDPALETRDYEAALTSLKASKFKEAAAAFGAFLKTYPNGSLTASAHYWGAYANAQAKDHAAAAELFGKFAAGWPDDERAPGALASQAASFDALKDWKSAGASLEMLVEKYPNSEAGIKAKLTLKKRK